MTANQHANPPAVVVKAFTWAYEELGWSRAQAAKLLSVTESMLANSQWVGFDADSLQSEIQLAFIRMYHSLYALSDGDTDEMQAWFNRENSMLKATPISLCVSLEGIEKITHCLETSQNVTLKDTANHVLPVPISHWE